MTAQIITYGLFGLMLGLGAQSLMPGDRSGSPWIAALLGADAALLGEYFTRLYLFNPGEGTTLFIVVLVTFLVFTVYRTAFRRLMDADRDELYTS